MSINIDAIVDLTVDAAGNAAASRNAAKLLLPYRYLLSLGSLLVTVTLPSYYCRTVTIVVPLYRYLLSFSIVFNAACRLLLVACRFLAYRLRAF